MMTMKKGTSNSAYAKLRCRNASIDKIESQRFASLLRQELKLIREGLHTIV